MNEAAENFEVVSPPAPVRQFVGSAREGMSHPLFAWSQDEVDWLMRGAVVAGRLEALRMRETIQTTREMSTPPGYRLTQAATDRLDQLDRSVNRRERRALLAHFRKHPIVTFERITS
jgi:hypothetical protein